MDLSKYNSIAPAPTKYDFTSVTFGIKGTKPFTCSLSQLVEVSAQIPSIRDFPLGEELKKERGIPMLLETMKEQGFEATVDVDEVAYANALNKYKEQAHNLAVEFKRELALSLGINDLPDNIGDNIIDDAWERSQGDPFESTSEIAIATIEMIRPLIESHRTLKRLTSVR